MNVYIYVIDEEDRIVSVSDNWLSFAQENQAAERCHPDAVINKPIWGFIDGIEVRHLYGIILKNVRSKKHVITIPYRCDAPEKRRFLELKIAPFQQKHIEFSSRIIREEPRDPVELLSSEVPRSDEFIIMCSICKRIESSENNWIEVETAIVSIRLFEKRIMPQISHGICPPCLRSIMEEIKRLR